MSITKCDRGGDVAGTAKKHQGIAMETKVKVIERMQWQGEEVTEEAKRLAMQETARGFSLSEEALLVLRCRTWM